MDAITDLTSQAVSFINIVQELCKQQAYIDCSNDTSAYFFQTVKNVGTEDHNGNKKLKLSIREITWVSKGEDLCLMGNSVACFLQNCAWITHMVMDFPASR